MGSVPFAFSVQHFVSTVGADAGFAALLGLAILVLLYFAHAREMANLREQASESAHRVRQLEARLAQLLRQPRTGAGQATPAPPPPGMRQTTGVSRPQTAAGASPVAAKAAGAGASAAAAAGATAAGRAASRPQPAQPASPTAAPMTAGSGVGSPHSAAAPLPPSDAPPSAARPAQSGAGGPQPLAGAPPPAATPQPPSASPGTAGTAQPGAGTPQTGTGAPGQRLPPAGMGAPPLSAATKMIPNREEGVAGPGSGEAVPPLESTAVSSRAAATAAGNGVGGQGGEVAATQAERGTIAARSGAAERTLTPRPVPASGASDPGVTTTPPHRPAPSARRQAPSDGGRGRRLLILAGAATALVLVAVVLVILTSAGGGSSTAGKPTQTSNATAPGTQAFNPASVTVAVLNGTSTSGLARKISGQLSSAGYKQGTIATASDQTQTATVVGFTTGHKHDAIEVASALKLGPASVQPVDSSAQAIACPPPNPCAASVVVTVGSDLT